MDFAENPSGKCRKYPEDPEARRPPEETDRERISRNGLCFPFIVLVFVYPQCVFSVSLFIDFSKCLEILCHPCSLVTVSRFIIFCASQPAQVLLVSPIVGRVYLLSCWYTCSLLVLITPVYVTHFRVILLIIYSPVISLPICTYY